MADHGIFYEHENLYQLLFGTSRDSVCWQLRSRGYKVRQGPNENVINADWDDGTGVEIHFDAGGCAQIFVCEYYAVLDGPPNPPRPVFRRSLKRR
jgi:hypothetical protein